MSRILPVDSVSEMMSREGSIRPPQTDGPAVRRHSVTCRKTHLPDMVKSMSIVILGAGRVGYQLARHLVEENRDVAVIEKDPRRAKFVSDSLDCLVVAEEGNRIDALKNAGIQRAEHFVAVTDSDEINLITCGIAANEFHVPSKIARVRNIDYTGMETTGHSFLGIDFVVNPEIEVAQAITAAIERGAVSDIMFFEQSQMQMRSIRISQDSIMAGKTVWQMREVLQGDFLVMVLLRGSDYIIPSGNTMVLENDKLYLLATEDMFEKIFNQLGRKRLRLDRVVVVGGSGMGEKVVRYLLERESVAPGFVNRLFRRLKSATAGKNITVIDDDHETCRTLSQKYPELLVLNADISDEDFEEEEHLARADLIVAATKNQELNIINAVYAKTLGTKRTVALVNKSSYVHMANHLGIDVAISPVDSMVSTILRHIRRSNVRRVYNISGSSIDIIEFSVEAMSSIIGKQIRDIKLPADSLIVTITRNGESFIPHGENTIESNDHLITIARKDSIPALETLFTG